MTQWGDWRPPPQDPTGHSESGFHFHLGARLGETVSELRALNSRMDRLPERIAMQLARYLPRHPLPEPKVGRVKQFIQLLQSGLPYVVLAKRGSLLLGIWMLAGMTNFTPDQVADMIIKVIGSFLGE